MEPHNRRTTEAEPFRGHAIVASCLCSGRYLKWYTKQVRTRFFTGVVARSPDRATRAERRSPFTARKAQETCGRPLGRGPETTPQQAESVNRILPTCLAGYTRLVARSPDRATRAER